MKWGEIATFFEKLPTSTHVILKWKSGLEIICEYNTQYNTDNNLDINDPNYEEYQGLAFLVLSIIHCVNEEIENLSVGNLIELSYKNEPDIVMDFGGKVIWRKSS